MTQGPWSVKGIDAKARSAAREGAQVRGVTLGQYLNSLLLDDRPAGIDAIQVGDLRASDAAPDDMRRMSIEIDLLSQRLEAAQTRSARTLSGVDKSILGLIGKVDLANKAQLGGLERVARALTDIETTQTALRGRIDTLESQGRPGQTLEALRALETSLARLAGAVAERSDGLERDQANFRDLFEQKVANISDRVDDVSRTLDSAVNSAVSNAVRSSSNGLTDRVDQIEAQMSASERRMDGALGRITDAASRFELFETKAERAASETTWRMERALESTATRSRALSKDLLDRVDSIEEKTRDAVGELGQAVARITERLGRAERKNETAIHSLERSVSDFDDKLGRAGPSGASDTVAEIKAAFQQRLDTLVDDLSRPIHAVRADVERRVEEALRSNQPEKIDRLERSIRHIQDQLEQSESRQVGAIEAMSAQIDRMSRAVDERLRSVEGRPDDRSIDDVRREMMRLADNIEARLDAAETTDRLAAGSIESLRQDVGRIDQSVNQRIQASERQSAAAITSVGDQVAVVAERLQRRHDESIQRLGARLDDVSGAPDAAEDFNRFAEKFDERVRDSERRSAEAIGQIGEQVARVADRLQTQHQESLRVIEGRLAESGRTHETRLADALADMSRRLDEIGDQSSASLGPVRNTVSSIARRLASLEDGAPASLGPPPFAPSASPSSSSDAYLVIDDLGGAGAPASHGLDLDDSRDIVGVEPPPFSHGGDTDLFSEESVFPSSSHESDVVPANAIDDLVDTDDMLLQPPPYANDFVVDLPPDDPADRPPLDYLAEARRAAIQGRRVPIEAAHAAASRKGVGRGPLVASAALALAVAGGGAWTVMRGKQEAVTDSFTRLDPSSPVAAEGDPAAAASDLFGDAPAPPLVEVAAPEIPEPTEPTATGAKAVAVELFEETSLVTRPVARPSPVITPTLADAVESGDPVALYDQALDLLQTGEKGRGVRLMKEAAGKGLVMAQYWLAKLYEKGEGVPRDMAASRSWTEKAAIGGNAKAMHDLAVFYAEGDSGPQSYAAAVEWFRQASDLGLVDSQYNLAVLYEQGLGLSQDPAEAAFWFEIAGRSGDPDGARRARDLLTAIPAAEAEQIRRRARAFNPRAVIARANGEFGRRPWDTASPAQISEAQRLLEQLGYRPGVPDGQTGARTVEAIRAFERDKGLPVTGEASVPLLRQLHAATLNSSG